MPGGSGLRLLVVLAVLLTVVPVCAETAAEFASPSLQPWTHETFDDIPPSQYRQTRMAGEPILEARCENGSASLYGVRQRINLKTTPVLRWEWRVEGVYSDIQEKTRPGDDFVARVYAVKDGGILKWRTRALNYVWASQEPAGSHWPNPFRDEAMMIVLRSGEAQAGEWVAESRNIAADFRRFFDQDLDFIDGVAIMTDCDNHGGQATVRFRNIRFSEQNQ